MKSFFSRKIESLVKSNKSATNLAISCVMGVFIAMGPYLGIQTLLIFIFSWIFRLSTPVVFSVAYIINNPWTMFPIVIFDYMVGSFVVNSILHVDLSPYDPAWVSSFNNWLTKKIGPYICCNIDISKLSLITYIIGGHIVAVCAAIAVYPLAKRFFTRIRNKHTLNS